MTPNAAHDDALLPCPFCGSINILVREGSPQLDKTAGEPAALICIGCDGRMFGYDLEATVAAWNRRAASIPPDRAGLIEAANRVLKAYDEWSGNEPSTSVLERAIDVDLRQALSLPAGGGEAVVDEWKGRAALQSRRAALAFEAIAQIRPMLERIVAVTDGPHPGKETDGWDRTAAWNAAHNGIIHVDQVLGVLTASPIPSASAPQGEGNEDAASIPPDRAGLIERTDRAISEAEIQAAGNSDNYLIAAFIDIKDALAAERQAHPAGGGEAVPVADMVGLLASERAPYFWPGEDQALLRDAYVRGAIDFAIPPVPDGYVSVPKSALDWLFGEGTDADGKWFHEVQDAFSIIKFIGKQPPYWWRPHFRKLIEAAPSVHAEMAEKAEDEQQWRCAECGCRSFARVDELKPNGHFGPGPQVRCLDCKTVTTFPATPLEQPSPPPATGMERVDVKPLEWQRGERTTLSRAETPVGLYRTWTHFDANGRWFWSLDWMDRNLSVATEAQAKAAAQADYEARILSAISLQPASGRAEVEALDAAGYYIDRLRTALSGKRVTDLEEAGEAFYRLAGEARTLTPSEAKDGQ